jgi:hypothetical protein
VCVQRATDANLWYAERSTLPASATSAVFARDPDSLSSAVRIASVYGALPSGGATSTFAHAATMLSSGLALHISTNPLAIELFSL